MRAIFAPPSFTAVLQAQGNVEDHEDAGRTSKTGPNYQCMAECVRMHRTEQHGVQRCRWLWPSNLRNEEEPGSYLHPLIGGGTHPIDVNTHTQTVLPHCTVLVAYSYTA